MDRAISRITKYGFGGLLLNPIEAIIDPQNLSSAKVLENCGYLREGHLRESEFYNGKFIDTVIYSELSS